VKTNLIHAFQRPPVGEEQFIPTILVTRMRGVIDRKPLDPNDPRAKSAGVTLVDEQWKGFDLQVLRVPEEDGGIRTVTFNVQIPLKGEAIQISIVGLAAREDETQNTLRFVLANLEGESNWLTPTERSEKLASGITKMIVAIGVLLGVVIVAVGAIRKRRRVPRSN
jgi:hypothetical protein